MSDCILCGFPRVVSRHLDWRSDGTIVSSSGPGPRTRVCFLEPAELDEVFEDLSKTMGMPLDPFLLKAQKEVGKAVFEHLPVRFATAIPDNKYFRPLWLLRLLDKLVSSELAALGGGRFEFVEYRHGERTVIRVTDPVLIPRQVGNAVGVYEMVTDVPSTNVEYHVEDGSGDLIITLSPGDEKPDEDAEARLYLEEAVPGAGWLQYERCSECGVPLRASEMFIWDMNRGIITNTDTGRREVVVAEQSFQAVMRELERELGEEITGHLYDHQKAQSRSRLLEDGAEGDDDFWDDYVEGLALRGLGYPESMVRRPGSIAVTTAGAYNLDHYAAKIAAALEATEGGASGIEWLTREGTSGSFRLTIG